MGFRAEGAGLGWLANHGQTWRGGSPLPERVAKGGTEGGGAPPLSCSPPICLACPTSIQRCIHPAPVTDRLLPRRIPLVQGEVVSRAQGSSPLDLRSWHHLSALIDRVRTWVPGGGLSRGLAWRGGGGLAPSCSSEVCHTHSPWPCLLSPPPLCPRHERPRPPCCQRASRSRRARAPPQTHPQSLPHTPPQTHPLTLPLT